MSLQPVDLLDDGADETHCPGANPTAINCIGPIVLTSVPVSTASSFLCGQGGHVGMTIGSGPLRPLIVHQELTQR